MREEHADPLPEPDERPDPERQGRGRALYHGEDLYGPNVDPVQARKLIGMVFQKPNPFPEVDLRQHRLRPEAPGHEGRHGRDRQAGAPRRPSGTRSRTGSGQRLRDVRRTAAAALHRPLHRRRARRDPHGRAVLGARPDLHGQDRGPDAGPEGGLLDRDRHPQHAAGGAGLGHDGLPDRRARRRRTEPLGPDRRVRRHREDLHQPLRPAHRGLRLGVGKVGGWPSHPGSLPGRAQSSSRREPSRARPGRPPPRPHDGGGRAPGRRAGPRS